MKKANLFLLLGLTSCMLLASCGSGDSSDKKASTDTKEPENRSSATTYDLSSNGIPVSIAGPAGAEIKKGMLHGDFEGKNVQNWELKKDKFRLDIMMIDTKNEETAAELLATNKDIDNDEEGFELVKEEPQGYIYKKKAEDGIDYDFYYVILKNDRAIEFSTGLNMDAYTLEEIETMYKAVKERNKD